MKWNYDIVVFDLETTMDVAPDGSQSNENIIEIGAVRLDRNLEMQERFEILVRPDTPITPECTKVTNITPDMVSNAVEFPEAHRQFMDWILSFSPNPKNIRLCAWGSYFDGPMYRKMCRKYGLALGLSGTVLCAKSMTMPWLAFSGRRTDSASVEKLAHHMGLGEPQGSYHRALVDADMTARVLQRALSDLRDGVFLPTKHGYRYLRVSLE